MSARAARQDSVAALRLPVPFFDLLMVLLVTCLVFVAPVRPDNDVRAMDIPVAQGQGAGAPTALLPVVPKREGQAWAFAVLGESEAIAPELLAVRAQTENRKVVLVVPPATPLQDFVAMQTTLAKAKVSFALAVQNKESAP